MEAFLIPNLGIFVFTRYFAIKKSPTVLISNLTMLLSNSSLKLPNLGVLVFCLNFANTQIPACSFQIGQ